MRPDPTAQSLAYLWLFSAGVDPAALDTSGVPLAESLASLLHKRFMEGRREAAGYYLQSRTRSGEVPAADEGDEEVTGEYPAGKLTQLRGKDT